MDVKIQTPFESLNQVLEKNLPPLLSKFSNLKITLIAKQEWGSDSENNRNLLKHHAKTHQGEFTYSSISHCKNLGVLVFSNQPVGVDIEQNARVAFSTVQRIASTQETKELTQALLPASFLWCAKEAAYKSLKEFNQPAVISALSIENWRLGTDLHSYKMNNLNDFVDSQMQIGWACQFEQWTLSVYTFIK